MLTKNRKEDLTVNQGERDRGRRVGMQADTSLQRSAKTASVRG